MRNPQLRYMTYLFGCLLALEAGFGAALLVIPSAANKPQLLAADVVPSTPPSAPQSFNLFDPVASPHATVLPAPETPVAKGNTDAAPPAVLAETEPATELSVALRPVTESRPIVEPPPWEQPQTTLQPQPHRPALKRQAATAATVKPPDRPPLRTRTAKRDTAGKKRDRNEPLQIVRKFSDDLQGIPITAYAGDGARRDVVIHPTSIQDIYYYSVPR